MKVRLYGFSVKQGSLPLSEFFTTVLKQFEGKKTKYRGEQRILYTAEKGDCFVGLLLTVRDQKRYCELEEGSSGFKIKVRELEGTNRLVEFNFFAVHKKSGNGLFQHYRGSFGLMPFCFYLKSKHAEECKNRRDDALRKAGESPSSQTSNAKEIRRRFSTSLEVLPLFKPADFEKLVRAMRAISAVSFSCEHFVLNNAIFSPSKKAVKKERHTITFEKKHSVLGALKNSIVKAAKQTVTFDGLAVAGVDEFGHEATYQLDSNLECFGVYEFDDVADNLDLDLENIANSPIVEMMMQSISSNSVYFR